MSSSRSTRSVTVPSDSGRAGAVVGTTPRCTGRPCSSSGRQVVVRRGGQHVEVAPRRPRRPAPVSSETGTSAAQQCATGVAPDSVTAAKHPLQRRAGPRRVDRPVPAEAGRGRHCAGQHGGQRGLVDLHEQLGARDPAADVGDVVAQPLGERLRQLAAGAVVGEHPVAARPLDGRGQRPRPGDLDLEGAGVALAVLLDGVEVLGQQRPGPAVVDAGGVGQPPPGRLQVGAELGDQRQRATGHVGVRAAAGQLGQVGQVGQLVEHHPDRQVVVRRRRSPGIDPTPVARVMPSAPRPRGRGDGARARRRGCRRTPPRPGRARCPGPGRAARPRRRRRRATP